MKGVVAAGHEETARAGAWALREGGNAFDAAVCAALTSFAAESLLTGPGAGGFMLAHSASGEDHMLDFFVEAGGRGADPSERADLVAAEVLFDEVPQVFNIGPASCGVPGTPAGLWEVSQRFGTMPFAELVKPGIRCALDGVRMNPAQAYVLELLEAVVTHYPETRERYAPGGRLLREGDLFRFPELAFALERLGSEGPGWIYEGDGAARISAWVSERGGTLSAEDFASYRVVDRPPVRAAYRGREVLTNPPPSSGGVLIAYALDLLERAGPAAPLDDHEGMALLVEVMAEANRVRAGDFHVRLFEDGFGERFLSGTHIEEALSAIRRQVAGGRSGGDAGTAASRLGSTTHLSVIDSAGNAAAVTCSNGTGSGVLVPGTGIHLNNMLGEEDLNPLGFHLHAPGTRVTSMMAPTLVLRDGEVEVVLGSAGSNRLRSAILQVIRHLADYGMEVGEAVRHGRVHFEGGVLHAEPGFGAPVLDELERRGYDVVRWRRLNPYFGGVQAACRDRETGALSGAGDPRRSGAVEIVE